MKKKLLTLIIFSLIATVLILGYRFFFAPKAIEGEKFVTIRIIAESQNIDEAFEYHTDNEFLFDLLKEKSENLTLEYIDYDMGPMITGFLGYEANADQQEYYHLLVNGNDALTGPIEIPIKDGDYYVFELRNYSY